MTDYITTAQAAAALGVNASRVRQLVLAGRLPAVKFAGVWMIDKRDLQLVKVRKAGRPPQVKERKE